MVETRHRWAADPDTKMEEENLYFNHEFVSSFETIKTFPEAAEFIVRWTGPLKHNPTDFP
jgi:hypothetical protein